MRSGENLNKPPDDPASASKPQSEVTINAGGPTEDTGRIATAEDFRRDWEKRGRPRSALEARSALSREEIEWIARQASGLWPQMNATQAAAECAFSWKAIQDSTLKMMREDAGLLTGLSTGAAGLATLGFVLKMLRDEHALLTDFLPKAWPLERQAWPLGRQALPLGQQALPLGQLGLEHSPEFLKRITEQVKTGYPFPFRQLLTDTLAQVAVQYVRRTTPRPAKQQTPPKGIRTRETAPRKEDARAEEKPVSSRAGEELVNTAATSLTLLDSELRKQVAIIRTPVEWEMLRQMKAGGNGKGIARWLNKRAQEAIRTCKRVLEMRPGRKRKLESEKEGYKLALKVEAVLPQFEKGMREKKELNRKRVRRLEQRLSALGYPPDIVECLMRYSRPVSAACAWVSEHSGPARDIQTVQNYYSKFRRLIPGSKSNRPEKKS